MRAISAENIVATLLLVTSINSCLGSWRDCNQTDLPCIQFGKNLCICTLFWDPSQKRRVFKYVCDKAPFDMPQWVLETWSCPEPGIGRPIGKVWLTFLDPTLKGLVKLTDSVTT
uniref:Queuine tRNA-ribosyltransferase n=1 Tax=Lygus hesperus TaxID=30085 RepID=A0A0A9Y168_LYGHE